MWLSRVWSWLMGPTEDEQMPDLEAGNPTSPLEDEQMPDLESARGPYASSSSSSGLGFPDEVSMEDQLDGQIQSCAAECRGHRERIVPILETLRRVRKGPSWQQEIKDCAGRKAQMEQDRERLSKEYQDCDSMLKTLLTMVESKKKGKASSSSPPSRNEGQKNKKNKKKKRYQISQGNS